MLSERENNTTQNELLYDRKQMCVEANIHARQMCDVRCEEQFYRSHASDWNKRVREKT